MLELTLKHVKALNNLLEQQQQKIISLQSGMQIGECCSEKCDLATGYRPAELFTSSPPPFVVNASKSNETETCLHKSE